TAMLSARLPTQCRLIRRWLLIIRAHYFHDLAYTGLGASAIVALFEIWSYFFTNYLAGTTVGQNTFQSITDLDTNTPILFRDHKQHAIILFRVAYLIGTEGSVREAFDIFTAQVSNRQNKDLIVGLMLVISEQVIQVCLTSLIKKTCTISDAAFKRR